MYFLKKIANIFNTTYKFKILKDTELCPICNTKLTVNQSNVIPLELSKDWNLNKFELKQFNIREGETCNNCGSSLRLRNIAKTIKYAYNTEDLDLSSVMCGKLSDIIIAEINYCGKLHDILSLNKNLYYSEYGSINGNVPHEDLMSLSYKDEMFDCVVNSDVLEHVPDFNLALSEINRIMKTNGYFIFTVPIIYDRKTKKRARFNKNLNKIEYIYSKSFHGEYNKELDDYLVFYEFGLNFVDDLKRFFDVSILKEPKDKNCFHTVFLCQKIIKDK